MPDGGGGTSVNPATTGQQGLDQYFDTTQKANSSGIRAPIVNISTGSSTLTPSITAASETPWWKTLMYVAAGVAAIYFYKQKKG